MTTLGIHETVGEIVTRRPALSRIFENIGIDYCCGGKKSLEKACKEKQLDPNGVLNQLTEAETADRADVSEIDAAGMTLTELVDHIEQTHHVYLRSELSRLDGMTEKVASVHGEKDSRLRELRNTFVALAQDLSSHMMKEEQILFPMVRTLEASETAPTFHCGSLANPIRQMEQEHDQAGSGLERHRELTDDFKAPDWACNTYRALLDALAHLERDLHQHIHKENNVLFPRALAMEERKGTTPCRR
ncbi:MAG: iron-sulfur cluster repair di-iron protein [Acidobacteriota bacterium]